MSDGRSKNPGLLVDPKTGETVGQHPDDISEADLLALGHPRHSGVQIPTRPAG